MMWEELRSEMTSPHDDEYAGILGSECSRERRGLSINMEITYRGGDVRGSFRLPRVMLRYFAPTLLLISLGIRSPP